MPKKLAVLHVGCRSMAGHTRLALTMADVFKGLGWDVTIYDRIRGETSVKKKAFVMGKMQMVTMTQKLNAPMVHFKDIREVKRYYPLKHLSRNDFRFEDIPIMHTPMGYPPMPKLVVDALNASDRILVDGEYFAMITSPEDYPKWADKSIFYIHWPIGGIRPSRFGKYLCNSKATQKATLVNWGVKSEICYPPLYCSFYHANRPMANRKYDVVLYSRMDKVKFMFIDKLMAALPEARFAVMGSDYGWTPPKGVDTYKNATLNTVVNVLSNSKIYVHLRGLDSKIEGEHFGQSIAEAVASGCLAIIPNAGGAVEIPGTVPCADLNEVIDSVALWLNDIGGKLESERMKRAQAMSKFDPRNRIEEFQRILA